MNYIVENSTILVGDSLPSRSGLRWPNCQSNAICGASSRVA